MACSGSSRLSGLSSLDSGGGPAAGAGSGALEDQFADDAAFGGGPCTQVGGATAWAGAAGAAAAHSHDGRDGDEGAESIASQWPPGTQAGMATQAGCPCTQAPLTQAPLTQAVASAAAAPPAQLEPGGVEEGGAAAPSETPGSGVVAADGAGGSARAGRGKRRRAGGERPGYPTRCPRCNGRCGDFHSEIAPRCPPYWGRPAWQPAEAEAGRPPLWEDAADALACAREFAAQREWWAAGSKGPRPNVDGS